MLMGKQGLRKEVEDGKDLGVPDGILINGLGPYRFDQALIPDGISFLTMNAEPGNFWSTYCNYHIMVF